MKTPEELHVLARDKVSRQYQDAKIDKKMLRWNDIVAVGLGYQASGGHATAAHGVTEAIQCCIVGHDMYSPGRGPLTLLEQFNQWSLASVGGEMRYRASPMAMLKAAEAAM